MTDARLPPAVAGFERNATAYERARPDYPKAAIAYLQAALPVRTGALAIELGAGTGKFTRAIVPWGGRLLAIEPTRAMRARLVAAVPSVDVLAATAEAIPVRAARAEVVLAAQAFHWFRQPETLDEVARVLRPGGALGLVWNVRDESYPWMAALGRLILDVTGHRPGARDKSWQRAFLGDERFRPLEEHSFPHRQTLDVDGVVDRVLSISYVGLLPPEERAAVGDRVRALLEREPETRGRVTIEVPYTTDVYVARRSEVPAQPRATNGDSSAPPVVNSVPP